MDVELPLYLGANTENMAKGAAVLGQTSIPVGGKNTNSVISGHRGYQGAPYFRDIEKLKVGDDVIIHNPWETLTYTVYKTAIIYPDDSDAVRIQEGYDMITLLTCHPYRSHGKYRWVVYCIRKEDSGDTEKTPSIKTKTVPEDALVSSTSDISLEGKVRDISGIIIVACIFFFLLKEIFSLKDRYR